MILTDPHFRKKDHAARWRRIAAHFRAHPADFAIAMEDFLNWLAIDNHDAEPLKSCSPFVGLPLETLTI